MTSSILLFVLIGLGLLYWWLCYTRQLKRTIEQTGYHAPAIVRSYHKEYVRVAGSWDWLDYPYVEYLNAEGERVLERLKYAESNAHLLAIGDEIEVVRYKGVLYYRGSLHFRQPNEWLLLLIAAAATTSYFVANSSM